MSDPRIPSSTDHPAGQPFSLHLGGRGGADLPVERVWGREALSKPFEIHVLARAAHAGGTEALSAWIEAPAVVSLTTAAGARRIHGIVARVEVLGTTAHGEEVVKLRIVPRLSRLGLRRSSRIFQDRTPQEIVSEILQEGGISHVWETTGRYPRRAYATQYEETDLAFVHRILAEVGIFYRFDPPGDADAGAPEILVLADARRYEPVPAPASVPFRSLAEGGALSGVDESITALAIGARMAPSSSVRRTYDFRRPLLRLESRSTSGTFDPSREWFEHDGEPEPSEHEMSGEDARLEQLRRKESTISGRSTCRRLVPGRRFAVLGHESHGFDGEYAVTMVRHDGRAADQATGRPVYENTFSCVRATERLRPPRPKRPVRHVIETATVVGPEGSDLHADEHGRVRVRFHWDRSSTPDERASCWIRTSQVWSGDSWGAQFLPRVGMEVLVGFLQGDPDQPAILGCVPNAVRPLPFGMLTRSGIVTRSTPGGGLKNELSFEDRQGAEELAVHAGRDLVMTSGRDAATSIGGNSRVEVRGHAGSQIGGKRTGSVMSDSEESIEGSSTQRVALGWTRTAGTDIVESAGANFRLSVAKGYIASVAGIASTTVGTPDRPSVASDLVHGDRIIRASGSVRVISEEGISLVCGDSRLDITPSGVRIAAAKVDVQGKDGVALKGAGPSLSLADEALLVADKVRIFAEKGQILLDKHARMNGETVKLNCSDEQKPPQREDGSPVELAPFRTKLTDHAFAPYADRTYHLVADGLRYEGKTTPEGLVDKPIPKGAKAIEITVWLGDYPEGERRTFHVRRGDKGADTVEGAQARLANLGYLRGAPSGAMDDTTRAALVSFQMDAGLPATGELDGATAGKLAAVQGG